MTEQNLHSFVSWAAGAFRASPADIIEGTLPLAGLAVQTIRWIRGLYLTVNCLIDARGTKRNAGTFELGGALCFTNSFI